MGAAILQQQFASLLTWQLPPDPDLVPTGIADIDSATGGLPRGALTEIVGPASSWRTSLLHSILDDARQAGALDVADVDLAVLMLLGGLRAVLRFSKPPRSDDLPERIVDGFLDGYARPVAG